jgi:hypothetical protein
MTPDEKAAAPTTILNLRNRAKVEENKERAAAWTKEAEEIERAIKPKPARKKVDE